MFVSYLAEPHIHECVSGLADFPHVQLSCPWCHASWVRCVQTSQLSEEKKVLMERSVIVSVRTLLQHGEKASET